MDITISGFLGANRAAQPKLLPDGVGVDSVNTKPGRGDLRPWRRPANVATVPAGRSTIYRMGRDVQSTSNYWLSWSTEVHAARGFDSEDTTERTYFTGSGTPKWTSNLFGLATAPYPTAVRELGVPRPVDAPIVTKTVDGGGGDDGDIWYGYTYVTDLGWESTISPLAQIVAASGVDTIRLSGFSAVPAGNYGITKIRIYRTITGASGSSSMLFLAEIASNVTQFDDTGQDLGDALATVGWSVPPEDGHHLTRMWGGMMAMLSGMSVRICEPHAHYAWPIAYEIVASDLPVACGVYRQNLVVLTTGRPIIISGTDPESLNDEPVSLQQACVSSKSVVSFLDGVAYASQSGLCWVGDGGARMLTAGLMLPEDWATLNPSTIVAGQHGGLYVASYEVSPGVRRGFVINPADPRGVHFTDIGFTACHYDDVSGSLFVLSGTDVQQWDAGTTATAVFRSKVFSTGQPFSLAYAWVEADDLGTTPATVRVYADGALRHTRSVDSRDAFSIPGGFLPDHWQFEVETQGNVQAVVFAEDIA